MKLKETYQKAPIYWPYWLTEEEQERIVKAAAESDSAKRDTIIIAGMLYLGLTAKEAATIRYCTANGDAIEREGGGAFLHIPNAYRRKIYGAMGNIDTIPLTERLIKCTQKEAEEAAERIITRSGFAAEIGKLRIRRTAARLHYINGWTWEGDIRQWFTEINFIRPKQNRVLYYREKTAEEEKAEQEALLDNLYED